MLHLISPLALLVLLSASQLDALPFRFSSFGMRSVISIENDTIHLSELYSRAQRRARIHYNVLDTQEDSDLYFDAETQVGLALTRINKDCSAVIKDNLYQALRLDSELASELFRSLGDAQESNHIVGPSKLLFYLVNQANKMRLIEQVDLDSSATRNRQTVEYQLEVQLSNDKAIISAYYDRDSYSQDSTRSSVPLQVNIRFDGPNSPSSSNISIAYFAYQVINGEKIQSRQGDLADLNRDVLLDEFAFPTSYNCSSVISDNLKLDIFEGQKALNARLTFESTTILKHSREYEHFVAFDGTIETLRIDTKRIWFSGREKLRDSSQVWDYTLNRRYIVSDLDVNLMSDFSLEEYDHSRCSVIYMDNPKTSRPRWPSLSSFLLGANEFVYMGLARIRGIDAMVYETTSDTLPIWFSQPMLYMDKDGKYTFRNMTTRLQESTQQSPSRTSYSTVVYVAREANGNEPKQLLRLEIFTMLGRKSSNYRTELSVDFKNFAYGLTDSPGGDRGDELFSLVDHCSLGSGSDRYAEVDMLLHEDPVSTDEDAAWLSAPNDRNQALLFGLNNVMKTLRTMMYDFSSKLITTSSNQRAISLSFRVAEHPKSIAWVAFVGNAGVTGSGGQRLIAQSLAECLWMIGQTQSSIYLFYYEAASLCVFDESAQIDPKTNAFSSNLIYLDPRQTGELFLISTLNDGEASMIGAWLRNENSRHLENRAVVLLNMQSDNGGKRIESKPIMMRVKDTKVHNVDFMSKINNDQQVLPPARTFAGFALNELRDNNRRLVSEADEETPLTLEQCKGACLEDLDCHSFSYCVEGLESRCVVSNTSFMSPGVREQLSSRQVMELRSGSQVEVQTETSTVSIERSLRCNLYNKFHSDLFKVSMSLRRNLDHLDLIPARDEEECAEICFQKSLDIMRQNIELDGKIKKFSNTEDLNSNELKDSMIKLLLDHKENMQKFCKEFFYLDSTTNSEENQTYINSKFNLPTTTTSYCAFSSETRDSSNTLFLFEEYQFDFSFLYEKHYGYALQQSNLSNVEQKALNSLNHAQVPSSADYDIIKQAVSSGKNFQFQISPIEPRTCAKQCFMQTAGPWPACRSFDIIAVAMRYGIHYSCVLNSELDSKDHVTPDDAEKPTLTQMWHYVPRFGITRQQVDESYFLETLSSRIASLATHVKTYVLGGFLIFIISILAIATGLFLGLKYTQGRFLRQTPNIEVEGCLSDMG